MTGRGVQNVNAGPHLPSGGPDFDPGNGGCFNCGDKGVKLTDFQLVHVATGKHAGHWRLCDPCWSWGNPRDPRETDPLSI